MPSVLVPPEIWSRIFFFVAPPLPYVGLERASFVEDAKAWRGDGDKNGQWKGIDNLMLVSRGFNTLVSPIFWSYLVLRSDARAVLLHLLLALRSRRERSAILDMVKVVWLPPVRDSGPSVGVPRVDNTALILAREMAKIVHIHIGSDSHEPTSLLMLGFLAARLPPKVPLEGLTGLFLDWTNFEVAMVALRHLAPSLRRLCICTEEDALPSAARHKELGAVHFPALKSLDVRTFDCGNPELWLERLVAWSWTLPRLSKIAIGVHLNAWSPERRSGDFLVTFESACLIDLGVVSASFRSMADLGLKELAFDFGPNEEEDQVDFAKFVAGLDRAERGQVSTIRDIVLIETIDKPGDAADHCLVELVNRRRLPSLEKVVWVLAQPGNDAAVWSQLLVRWSHDLVQAGVRFEIQ